ncbi:MAG TPA: DUF305 domain-containing protein [Flavisolibacter sp.]
MRYLPILFSAWCISCGDNAGSTHHTETDTSTTIPGNEMNTIMHRMMEQMNGVPSSGSADRDFAALMKVHHEAAVEMARAELTFGNDQTMKNMAEIIISDQEKEIRIFDSVLRSDSAMAITGDAFYREMKSLMQHPASEKILTTDVAFASATIPHHQGAIDMSTAYRRYGKHPRLLQLASTIIESQKQEITQLQSWLMNQKQ